MSSKFSLKRIELLIKWQLADKQFRTMQLFTWGVLFFTFYAFNSKLKYDFSNTILLFGFIFSTSQLAFLGKQSLLATNYFLIPCSTFERIVSSFLLSTIYYLGIVLITYVVSNLAGSLFNEYLWKTHNTIDWNFLTIKGAQVHVNHDVYKNIDVWALFGKIAFIQAFAICSQFLMKQNSIRTVTLIIFTLVICFTIINPGSFMIFKSFFNNNQANLSSTTPDLVNEIQNLNTMTYLLATVVIWRINYSILINKQV